MAAAALGKSWDHYMELYLYNKTWTLKLFQCYYFMQQLYWIYGLCCPYFTAC